MTRVTVAPGQAVNVQNDRQYGEGETFEADDREAVAWLDAQLVMPAKAPAKKATRMPAKKATKKATKKS